MSTQFRSIGPRGLAVLSAAAVAGIFLAAHGWSTSHNTAFNGIGSTNQAGASSPPSSPASQYGPNASQTSPPPASAPAGQSTGPLLSSQSYAQYSFLVWPGKPSPAAAAAMTGLSITVHQQGAGISVLAGVTGQPMGPAHTYPHGARVYIIEAAMGDDSGNSDYNLGDDGLVVTDSAGRILQ